MDRFGSILANSEAIAELRRRWAERRVEWQSAGAQVDGEKVAAMVVSDLDALAKSSGDRTLSVAEAAAITGLHPDSIGRRIRKGQLDNLGTRRRPRVRLVDLQSSGGGRGRRNRSDDPSPGPEVAAIAREAIAGRLARAK